MDMSQKQHLVTAVRVIELAQLELAMAQMVEDSAEYLQIMVQL